MFVFYKNWQGIGESPVRNEFHREARWNRPGRPTCRKNTKTVVAMDVYLDYECWKHQYLWCENVDVMMSQCLWIPYEFYSSLANQIMCNKQFALE